ncbi:PRD domain-containing protein [Virgibacillus sp. NKC19-3]|uniref:PRD domain-containing protein n=1 Tax=Virgibacillus saliphilus TaxID=2831674 RepID=UPI001C9B87AB|nr:PRD domain-containing protein [Virgibacillus sp. NKC19-3]MBY7144390.1 PRD domain-containing protein [Virgibacillus sp. NKC19-3]
MEIVRILNNNVVEVKKESGNHVIVIGNGIGFRKHKGDFVKQTDVDKVFILTNKQLFPTVENLLLTVPTHLIESCNLIVNYGREILGDQINQNIIITLTDHLNHAINKARDGFTTPNPLNWDIKKFYPEEYEVGKYALDIVKKNHFVSLPEDEAGFIAMHFVAAIGDSKEPYTVIKVTEIMKAILNIVKAESEVELDEESLAYTRFIRHIQFLAIRALESATYSERFDDEISVLLKQKYENEYVIAEKIAATILIDYNIHISSSEKLYMTMHLASLLGKRGANYESS